MINKALVRGDESRSLFSRQRHAQTCRLLATIWVSSA